MSKRTNTISSNLSVIMPYKDLEALLNSANRLDKIEKQYDWLEKRYVALQQMFSELLEKVAEMDKYM